jgi:hypothetical protein
VPRLNTWRTRRTAFRINQARFRHRLRTARDDPVEPEDQAINWWIHHNPIYNSHGWFSVDGVGGGPVYIWGNVGWFDDKPARNCITAEWAADRTLHADGSYAPTPEHECSHSRTGKVIKLCEGDIELTEPIYVQLTSDYTVANGIRLPTKRRAYARGADRRPILELLMVSIDISEVRYS